MLKNVDAAAINSADVPPKPQYKSFSSRLRSWERNNYDAIDVLYGSHRLAEFISAHIIGQMHNFRVTPVDELRKGSGHFT